MTRRAALSAAVAAAAVPVTSCSQTANGDSEEPSVPQEEGRVLTALTMAVGQAVRTDVLGPAYIVTRTGEASAVAFSATCPHTGCSVQTLGTSIACPCHGSVFDVRTGAVVRGPALRGLDVVSVAVVNGNVVTA